MTRTLQNPLKGDSFTIPPAPEISLCMVTHYTDEPYHRFRIPVIDLCVDSYRRGTAGKNYEFIIWDNGSTPEFRKQLQEYDPDVLILSPNVGKASARLGLAHIARGDIFCFSDDDILYYPDWLDAHLDLLYNFPQPVMVSGSPYRLAFNHAMSTACKFAYVHKAKLSEELTSEEDERLYAISIGQSWERHRTRIAAEKSYTLEWNEQKAWAHGHHAGFVTWREDILPHLRPSKVYLDNERVWEDYLDSVGYLRLTTYPRSWWHMGNELDGQVIIKDGKLEVNKKEE